MAPRSKKMTDSELASLLDGQITSAQSYSETDFSGYRTKALEYFDGVMSDVPAQVGRSSVVSRDFADTHGWIMPSLLRVFLGSDRVVVYEPRKPDSEQAAKQATDYVNYLFLTDCNGYRVLHTALHDGLALGNGVIKHWWDKSKEYATEEFTGLSDDEYTYIVSNPDVETVLEHTEYPDPAAAAAMPSLGGPDGGMGDQAAPGVPLGSGGGGTPLLPGAPGAAAPAPVADGLGGNFGPPPLLHDVKLKRITSHGRLRLAVVPREDFFIESNARALDEEDMRFCAHRSMRTRSSLIKEGFARAKVEDIESSGAMQTPEQSSRDSASSVISDISADRSTDLIEVFECYMQVDYDGDGVAEWRKVVMAGGIGERQMLANDEWGDQVPFTDLVPDPRPHRWRGGSLFDETSDIMRVKTVLLRGGLDNLYWVNNPQRWARIDAVENLDELNTPSFNGVLMVRDPQAVGNLEMPFVADKAFAGMDRMDQIREFRTGVSASSMALDPETMTNQTATAVNAQQSASYSKVETYARNIAEVGLKRLFGCLLKLIVKHQDRARTIRLRGEWVEMNPQSWDAEMDVTINTGLGAGNRDRDLQMLQGIALKQEQVIMQMGPANDVLGLDDLFETYRKMAEAAGLRSPETFFPEITPEQMQALKQMASQQKPDPKMMEVQAKVQANQAQMQAELQMKQAQAQVDQQAKRAEMQAKLEQAVQQMQMDHAMNTERMNREFELKKQEMQANAALKVQELQLEAQLKREQMVYTANQQAASNIQEAGPL